jgi:hypothetical protein
MRPFRPAGDGLRTEAARRRITPEGVDMLLDLCQGHPHRAQQLAFHAFRLAKANGEAADEEIALATNRQVLRLSPRRDQGCFIPFPIVTAPYRSIYKASARRPTIVRRTPGGDTRSVTLGVSVRVCG